MDTWAWVVVAIAAVVAIALVSWAVQRRRQRELSEHLRQRFGPEYDRVAGNKADPDRRAGETELRRREMRRDHLEIRPLAAEAQQRYQQKWAGIQSAFVDEPESSVAEAEHLVNEVMRQCGYPVADEFDNQAELISVDHPELVNNYRQAHRVFVRSQIHEADTEELRNSLVYYRSLFNELLAA